MPFMLILGGQQFTNSSITAVLTGTVPFFVVLLGPLIIKSRLTLPNLPTVTVGFIGLFIMFYPSLVSEEHGLNFLCISTILVDTISFAIALLIISKYTHKNPVIVSRNILISSSIQLLILATIFAPYKTITIYTSTVFSVVYLGVACTGIVYYFYALLIKEAGASLHYLLIT